MIRKFLLTLVMAAFAAGPLSSAYANPDDEDDHRERAYDLIVVHGSDLAK